MHITVKNVEKLPGVMLLNSEIHKITMHLNIQVLKLYNLSETTPMAAANKISFKILQDESQEVHNFIAES